MIGNFGNNKKQELVHNDWSNIKEMKDKTSMPQSIDGALTGVYAPNWLSRRLILSSVFKIANDRPKTSQQK